MIIYFHRDGSQTISRTRHRVSNEDRGLEFDALRIIEIRDDGAVIVRRDKYSGRKGELLAPLLVAVSSRLEEAEA